MCKTNIMRSAHNGRMSGFYAIGQLVHSKRRTWKEAAAQGILSTSYSTGPVFRNGFVLSYLIGRYMISICSFYKKGAWNAQLIPYTA